MSVHAAETHDIETRIAEAAIATEALARRYFGQAAYLRRDVHEDRETGEERPVFEVHYCFDDWEENYERLTRLNDAFMHSFVRALAPDIVAQVILRPIPTDAD